MNIDEYKDYCGEIVRVIRACTTLDEVDIAIMAFECVSSPHSDYEWVSGHFMRIVYFASVCRYQAIKSGDI